MRFIQDNKLMLEGVNKSTAPIRQSNGLWYKEWSNKTRTWYKDKECTLIHNPNGPAAILANGIKLWFTNNKRHRLDGPAIVNPDGTKQWFVDDKRHRLDGPAVEYADGRREWYVNDRPYSEENFNKLFGKYKDVADKQVVLDIETMFE